jgi:hypothetical protein
MINKYKMDHDRRGIALVINIRNFDEPNPFKLEERVWSEKDVKNLKQTLEYLEFDFKLLEDLKANEIQSTIQGLSSIDHSQSDCFLCVVMSHGNDKDMITTSDNKQISFEEIMAPIKSCESLKNKPKLFLFQACRGETEMEFARSNPPPIKKAKNAPILEISSQNVTDSIPFDGKIRSIIENESDLLVYYSTLPNHLSFGNLSEGTTFIKSVCDVFNSAYKQCPNNLSLSQMITKINEKIRDKGEQLAETRSILLKEVYFTPKNVSVSYN